MKKSLHTFIVLFCTAISLAAEVKVEFGPIPEWQKPVMDKVTFGVKARTLSEILHAGGDKTGTPSFLVFTAEAAEDLGKRLLWVDAEVEFSNGVVRNVKNVSFHLLTKGIEADVKKLDDIEDQDFVLPGDEPQKVEDLKPIAITKLKITNIVLK